MSRPRKFPEKKLKCGGCVFQFRNSEISQKFSYISGIEGLSVKIFTIPVTRLLSEKSLSSSIMLGFSIISEDNTTD